MENNQSPEKTKSQSFSPNLIDKESFQKAINKRKILNPSDFSIENFKNMANSNYTQAKEYKDLKDKYDKLKMAVSFDNTNEEILKEFLLIEKTLDREEYEKNINKYYYHLSPDTYKTITGKTKDKSSVDKLLEIFNIFKSYNIEQKDINEEIKQKHKITNYFYLIKGKAPYISTNIIFSIVNNLELALYEAYISLFNEINNKISTLYKIATDPISNLKEKLSKICPDDEWDNVKEIIQKKIVTEDIILLYKTKFFDEILFYIKYYVLELEDIINNCLKLKDKEIDFYTLLFIILDIKYMITHESESIFLDKIKKISNKDDKNVSQNIIFSKIKNIEQYNIDDIMNDMKIKKHSKSLNEIMINKYIKIQYYNKNNIIQRMMKFIQKFNEKISKSITIKTVLYKIYPDLKNYNLFESEFTENVFKNALKNCYFFPFHGIKGSITLRKSGTILFFIPNRTKIKEKDLDLYVNKELYLIGNLGVFLYIEFHEILGYYLRIIISKILDYDIQSPIESDSENFESGECIEYLLFGKRISLFTIKQLLYLLDVNNYNKELEKFKEDFNNKNSKKFIASEEFISMLKEIDITLDINFINNDDEFTKLFKDNYILEDYYLIETPKLYDCTENYEIISDGNFPIQ